MAACPGCGGEFQPKELLQHCFDEHPTMPVEALSVLVNDVSKKLAELAKHKQHLLQQADETQARYDAISGK